MAQHTPGPWTVNGYVIEQDAPKNAALIGYAEDEHNPDWQANVQLLAAAPDLLAALRSLHELLEEHEPQWYLRRHDRIAQEAIAKALPTAVAS